jgi:tungstate transport system ATP-binding protein
MKVRGVAHSRIDEKTQEVLKLVGLEGFEKREARRLSGGEQQRVALGRALALEPEVLLLDEPTASIDRKHAQEVESIIRKTGLQKNMTVIFSTHNHHQATSLAQKVISLFEGRVEQFAYENFFFGTASESEGGPRIRIHPDIAFPFSGGTQGAIHVSIDPLDVIVSRRPAPPARGACFRGKLIGMTMSDPHVKLTLDIGVPLVSSVTDDALKKLNPSLGEELYCAFDADAVRIMENGKNT